MTPRFVAGFNKRGQQAVMLRWPLLFTAQSACESNKLSSLQFYLNRLQLTLREFADQLMGRSLVEQGNPKSAEPLIRESLDLRRKVLSEDHWLIASSQGVLGNCLARLGRFTESETLLLTSYSNLKKTLGKEHERTAEALQWIINLYQAWGRSDMVERYQSSVHVPSP